MGSTTTTGRTAWRYSSKHEVTLKPLSDYDKSDFEKMEVNAMAIKLLHCGLGPHEHNRIMGCKSAKQIWDLLESI